MLSIKKKKRFFDKLNKFDDSPAKRRKPSEHEIKETIVSNKSISKSAKVGRDMSHKRVEILSCKIKEFGGSIASKEEENVNVIIASEFLSKTDLLKWCNLKELPTGTIVRLPEWLILCFKEKKLQSNDSCLWLRSDKVNELSKSSTEISKPLIPQKSFYESTQDSSQGSVCSLSQKKNISLKENLVEVKAMEMRRRNNLILKERAEIFLKNNEWLRERMLKVDISKKINQEAFACQRSSFAQRNLNEHLTSPIEALLKYLSVDKDIWREYTYKRVASVLKFYPERLSSIKSIRNVKGISDNMKKKLIEILDTGRFQKLEAKKSNKRLQTLINFANIWGVGPSTAHKLAKLGYDSIDALKKEGVNHLSTQQKIGLKHYDDFLTRIPRKEVTEIEKVVISAVTSILPNALCITCGSYRRGKLHSGDCDILITDPDNEECTILPDVLKRLHESGFLTGNTILTILALYDSSIEYIDDLTTVKGHHLGGCDSYMGVCRLKKDLPYRRIDIKVYPRKIFPFAILYFTGSDHFNRSMRLLARKKGFSLSDRGLFEATYSKGKRILKGREVNCTSEIDIFIALGIEYKDPLERNCFDLQFLNEDEEMAKAGGGKDAENAEII